MGATRRRIGTLRALVVFAAIWTGCARSPGVPAVDRPERLAGRWTGDFRLVVPLRLREDTARAGTLHGEIVLTGSRDPASDPGLAGPPTHLGVHTVDFARFHLGARAHGHVPTAAARLTAGDSVEVMLQPSRVKLVGRLRGDSIVGRWSYHGDRSAGANGRFILHRDQR